MGCTQSKIENEEIVNRCKERKTVMKESVSTRNAFAAAHFSYAATLKNTGAALSDYAQGEVEFSDHHNSSGVDVVTNSSTILPPAPPQPPYETFPPPPPPPALQRASTMPEFVVETEFSKAHPDPIMEDDDVDDDDDAIDERSSLKHRSSRSSGGGIGGGRSGSKREVEKEDLPPPTPPEPTLTRQNEKPLNRTALPPPAPHGMSSWDYFFPDMENVPGPSLTEVHHDNNRFERKVIHEEIPKSDDDDDDVGGGDTEVEEVVEELVVEEPPPPPPKVVKKVRVPVPVPMEGRKSSGKGGGQSLNLLQIFTELDDCFLKTSESANEVSKMLEANRLHYHSNFADNKGILLSFIL